MLYPVSKYSTPYAVLSSPKHIPLRFRGTCETIPLPCKRGCTSVSVTIFNWMHESLSEYPYQKHNGKSKYDNGSKWKISKAKIVNYEL